MATHIIGSRMFGEIGRGADGNRNSAGADGNMWRGYATTWTSRGTASIDPPPPTRPSIKPTRLPEAIDKAF